MLKPKPSKRLLRSLKLPKNYSPEKDLKILESLVSDFGKKTNAVKLVRSERGH